MFAVAIVTFVPVAGQNPATAPVAINPTFETYLESLRVQAGIPGLSAAIVKDGAVAWERGFGYQNVEARIPATPDTPYPVGDISETFATTLLLQCVEERHLSSTRLYRSTARRWTVRRARRCGSS